MSMSVCDLHHGRFRSVAYFADRGISPPKQPPFAQASEKLMPIGALKACDRGGFGFIRPRAGGADIFFHFRDLGVDPADLVIGDKLQYEVGTARDGCEIATRVRWAED